MPYDSIAQELTFVRLSRERLTLMHWLVMSSDTFDKVSLTVEH